MAFAIRRSYRDRNGRKRKCRAYIVCWQDVHRQWHRLPTRYTDKQAAVDLGNRLERESAQGEEGRRDLYAEARSAPLSRHVADWTADLATAGRDDKYTLVCKWRMNRLIAECHWNTLADVSGDSFIKWRTAVKDKGNGTDTGKGRKAKGPRTLNEYLETARAMLSWCVRQKRLPDNPLAAVGKLDTTGDIRRKRRALSEDELRRLLAAAPEDRRRVYLFAATTGLRRQEIADLRWYDLHLNATKPYIALRAAATKARRADCVYLRQDMAEQLRKIKPADESGPVFARVPSMIVFRNDLAAAGIPELDAQKRRVDFHGLRVSLATIMARSGVSPRTAMEVMRHTDIRLTLQTYTDPQALAVADAVESLPDLTKPAPEADAQAQKAVRTGTDDRPVERPADAAGPRSASAPAKGICLTHPLTHETDFSLRMMAHGGAVDGAAGAVNEASPANLPTVISPLENKHLGAVERDMAHDGASEKPGADAGLQEVGAVGFEPT
ncbi:MAG: tyrosine-type recombinase/integrase [Phycisphaerae bacterium]